MNDVVRETRRLLGLLFVIEESVYLLVGEMPERRNKYGKSHPHST
jgi:hypothetical protein